MSEHKDIILHPVTSSQIQSIGFDSDSNTLAICFAKGGVYHYSGVSDDLYQKFKNADSVGSFFFKTIKSQPDKFPYSKVK